MRHRIFLVLAASIILLGFTSHSLAQERIDLESIDYSKYRLEMVKVEEAPIIDGLLDDEVWKLSPVGTGFTQFSPDYLAPATERTEVRVLYDDKKLYVGGMCYDSEPEKVVAREMRRDANIYNTDDTFAFTLSAVPDYSIVIMFNTSPGGAQRDAYIGNFGETFNDSWDGIWKVRAKRHDQGWSVEIEIPYKTLRFPNNDVQDWAAIFRRQIRRKRETSYWPPLSRSYGFATWYKMQQGVKLAGMKDVKPGRALEILPYVTLGALGTRRLPGGVTNPTPAQTNIGFETAREAGGNIKWGVTPNITADATVNPDFANIESDPEVVNLSRFEFQFTERRPFFLEGVDLFGFGQSAGFGAFSSGALPLFFSRRIGSPAGGSIIPIDFAAKLSGKTRRTNFAYLNAQTGGLTPSFGPPVIKTNWQVMRIRQDLSRESSIGVMALFKEPDEIMFGFAKNNYNRVLGFDGFFRLGSTQHRLETLLAKSWLPASDPRMIAIANSGSSYMGLKSDGSITAWGQNYYGECDIPTPNDDFVAVSMSHYHSMGLKIDGSVVVWGDNTYGQCDVPEPNTGFVTISTQAKNCLALRGDGSIVAWGDSSCYQCDVPEPNTGFIAIAAGVDRCLAIREPTMIAVEDPPEEPGPEVRTVPALTGIELLSITPNPFNPTTAITFEASMPGSAVLEVLDVAGHRILSRTLGVIGAGSYTVRWDGRDERGLNVSSGFYFVRIRLGDRVSQSAKAVLVR